MLYVSHRETSTEVLGPGKRYALWLQGCKKRCKGCVFPEGQPLDSGGEWLAVEKIFQEIQAAKNLTGITISGGEPFLQVAALAKLIKLLRQNSNLDVMIYSGYTIDELKARHDAPTDFLLSNIDILIDGEYIEELNTNSIYRGSDNQNIHFLSKKYLPFKEKILQTKNRSIEFVCRNNDELFMIGVPAKNFSKDFFSKLEVLK